MTPTVILLNGPPRSGKDSLSNIIKQYAPDTHQEKFAGPLKACVPSLYGISIEEWKNVLDTPATKDHPSSAFFGQTPRAVQIAISERLLKPLHGKDVFGRLLVSRISRLPKLTKPTRLVVVSDSGFRDEAERVVEFVGGQNTFLVRLHRQDCDYRGDSRGYISLDDLGVRSIDFINSEGIERLTKFGQGLLDVASIADGTNESVSEAKGSLTAGRNFAWAVLCSVYGGGAAAS